jgi:hypothetical protein
MSFYPDVSQECGKQELVYSSMTCTFTSESFTCNIGATRHSVAWSFSGLYSLTDDRLSLSWKGNQTLCVLTSKTFNQLLGTWDPTNPGVCVSSLTQCDSTGTRLATLQSFDLFGPGLSSFELFGLLVAGSATVVIIAVLAEACRSRVMQYGSSMPTSSSTITFFVLAMGMTIAGERPVVLRLDGARASPLLLLYYYSSVSVPRYHQHDLDQVRRRQLESWHR